jgi:hypothetical protein
MASQDTILKLDTLLMIQTKLDSIGLVLSEEKIFQKSLRRTTDAKIEHMVKLQVFGNNLKTVNNIKNLTG